MLKGDFSHLVNSSGNPIVIYDPLSTRLGPDGLTFIRTPFLGNVIPPERINPIAAKVAAFYPSPNLPGISGLNNYQKILPQTNGYDSWLGSGGSPSHTARKAAGAVRLPAAVFIDWDV